MDGRRPTIPPRDWWVQSARSHARRARSSLGRMYRIGSRLGAPQPRPKLECSSIGETLRGSRGQADRDGKEMGSSNAGSGDLMEPSKWTGTAPTWAIAPIPDDPGRPTWSVMMPIYNCDELFEQRLRSCWTRTRGPTGCRSPSSTMPRRAVATRRSSEGSHRHGSNSVARTRISGWRATGIRASSGAVGVGCTSCIRTTWCFPGFYERWPERTSIPVLAASVVIGVTPRNGINCTLGRVNELSDHNQGGRQVDECQERQVELVVAGGDPAELLQLVEQPLDPVPLPVVLLVIGMGSLRQAKGGITGSISRCFRSARISSLS